MKKFVLFGLFSLSLLFYSNASVFAAIEGARASAVEHTKQAAIVLKNAKFAKKYREELLAEAKTPEEIKIAKEALLMDEKQLIYAEDGVITAKAMTLRADLDDAEEASKLANQNVEFAKEDEADAIVAAKADPNNADLAKKLASATADRQAAEEKKKLTDAKLVSATKISDDAFAAALASTAFMGKKVNALIDAAAKDDGSTTANSETETTSDKSPDETEPNVEDAQAKFDETETIAEEAETAFEEAQDLADEAEKAATAADEAEEKFYDASDKEEETAAAAKKKETEAIERQKRKLPLIDTNYDILIRNNRFLSMVNTDENDSINTMEAIFQGDIIIYANIIVGAVAILWMTILGAGFIFAQGNDETISKKKQQFGWIALGLATVSVAEYAGFQIFNPVNHDLLGNDDSSNSFYAKAIQIKLFFQYVAGSLALIAGIRSGYNLITIAESGEDESIEKEKEFVKTFFFGIALILFAEVLVTGILFVDGTSANATQGVLEIVGLINFAITFLAGAAVFMLVLASLYYIISFGNEDQANRAKQIIISCIIALIIIFSSFTIVRFLIPS
ncbi:hypothetical protein KAI58_02040 [Candidatus Gracilibacteria bacterium]|nr:hypothetical protein [Candidatus Gracilibacteria bacterium]